ncbi:MAG: flagellar basal body L-ring protein FlgH [Candidatus Riflebacteria bacterium]|nr:flagellar basal body L-ring protein FlgH [Candidatus Riflebacteria bacterium]
MLTRIVSKKNRLKRVFCLSLIAAFIFSPSFIVQCSAASLWLNGHDLYSMQGGREFKTGDIVTVMVSEETTAQQSASTNTVDDSQLEIKSSPEIPVFKKFVNQLVGKNEVKNNWRGNGETTRSGKLAGTVTTRVLEVLKNGSLILEGFRSIRVNKETQLLKVRGIARPQDIDSTNTINSKLLAEAEIKYEGKGSVGSTQRPGLMTKISNFIF